MQLVRDGNEVGKIVKEYSGALKEIATEADNFYVTFPAQLELDTKIILIGAVLLLVS